LRSLEIRYVITVFATVILIAGTVLVINLLVDPLWYFKGNVISGVNYQYNERHSKAYLFLKRPKNFDCLIFGSSTGSLINEKKIQGHRCFNFSFSLGNAKEFATYANFAKRYLENIRLVVVSIDPYTLIDRQLIDRSPPFVVHADAEPPSVLNAYLALDTFRFSLTGLTGERRTGVYYRSDFTAAIHPKSPTYEPAKTLARDFKKEFHHGPTEKFTNRNFKFLREMRRLFPDAQFVGVAPPIAAHYIGFLRLSDNLDDLLEVKHRLVRIFDRFYDFSLPSQVTKNPDNTYDGAHFDVHWYDHVVDSINGGSNEFALRVHELSLGQYLGLFLATADDFIAESDIRLD
jgi:hypothetical protein